MMTAAIEPDTNSNRIPHSLLREPRQKRDAPGKSHWGFHAAREWTNWIKITANDMGISQGELVGIAIARLAEELGKQAPPRI